MPESTSTPPAPRGRHRSSRSRLNLRERCAGRGRITLAATALLGLGAAATAAIALDGPRTPAPATAAPSPALDESARALAADRPDRAARDQTPTPADTPPASPSRTPAGPDPRPDVAAADRSPTPPPKKKTPRESWTHPLPGARVTSCYGWRWGAMHAGVDLSAAAGTPVRAVGDGTVVAAGWNGGYGIATMIRHDNGYLTHYAHLSGTAAGVGQRVTTGEVIGYEGSTGDSTGPHLHFEVHQGRDNQVEPVSWLRSHGVSVNGC